MKIRPYILLFTTLLFILSYCNLVAQQREWLKFSNEGVTTSNSKLYILDGKSYDCILVRKYQIKNGVLLGFIIREDTSLAYIQVVSPNDLAFYNRKTLKKGERYSLSLKKYETFKPHDDFDYGENIDLLMGSEIISFTYRFADDLTIYTCLDFDYKKKRKIVCEHCAPSIDTIASICNSFIKSIIYKEDATKITSFADTVQMEDIFNRWSHPCYDKIRFHYNHIPQNRFKPDNSTIGKFKWENWGGGGSTGYWASFCQYIHAQWQIPDLPTYSDYRILKIKELYAYCDISTYLVELQIKKDILTPYSIIVSIRWKDCKIVAVNRIFVS